MLKNKKQKNKLIKDFKANQKFFILAFLVFALTISASSILYSSYRSLNFLASSYLSNQVKASNQPLSEELIKKYKKLSLYENYIKSNMSLIVPVDISSPVVVDGVSFICEDRALIFYHDQVKNLISEVVLRLKDDNSPELAKVYLKNSGDKDYSQGVYGADPN
jgi:hypothetical protein